MNMQNLAGLTADCYQLTEMFEQWISGATYGDECESICNAVFSKTTLPRDRRQKERCFFNGRGQSQPLNVVVND